MWMSKRERELFSSIIDTAIVTLAENAAWHGRGWSMWIGGASFVVWEVVL